MKHIKQYKIFESDSISLSDKVKECFLPVIDILYEDFKISVNCEIFAQVNMNIANRKSNELINEIIDGIYHLESFDLEIRGAYLKYLTKIKGYKNLHDMEKEFHKSYNFEKNELVNYISLIDCDKLTQLVLYITPM